MGRISRPRPQRNLATRINSLNLASLSAAMAALASGAASPFSGAIAGARLRLSQLKPIQESKTRQAGGPGGYTKARTGRAASKCAALKRRNVLRNRRAHR